MFSGFKEKLGSFIVLGIIWALVFSILGTLTIIAEKGPSPMALPSLFYLLSLFCYSLSVMQYIRISMAAYHKESLSLGSFFSMNPVRVVQFTIIHYLRWIAICLGLLIFIFPGIYVSVMYAFPGYALIDGSANSITGDYQAITTLTKHVRSRLFLANIVYYLFFIAFIPLAFIAFLPLIILIIPAVLLYMLIAPMATLFSVHLYEQLKLQEASVLD
jgi:hypothetical protein